MSNDAEPSVKSTSNNIRLAAMCEKVSNNQARNILFQLIPLNKLMQQSVSWTTICCYDVNKILALFINRNFVHPPDVIKRERNPVHSFPRLFFSIPFNIPPKRTLKLHSYEDKIGDGQLGHSPRTENDMKICPVRAESFFCGRMEGQTERQTRES
jgi:hypothetical protein